MTMLLRAGVCSLLLGAVCPAAELALDRVPAAGADTATLNVSLSEGEGLTGLQFDLEYDLTAYDVTVEAGPAALKSGKVAQAAKVAGAKQRVLLIGFNRQSLAGGVVAVVHIAAKPNQEPGGKRTIRLTGTAGTDDAGHAQTVTATGGAIALAAGGTSGREK